jgi:hypothetical protein
MNNFIIPQTQSSIIASIDNNAIHELGRIDIPYNSKSVITENGLIVALCFSTKPKSKRLEIFDMSGKQLLRLPQYKYRAIACKNNVVYLGGQYATKEKELFASIDLSNVDFSIKEIQLPIKTVKGKSIDDILIRDNMLYLVDNIIFPKYIFHYDISTPENPVHTTTKKLLNNGTYEHIIKGEITKNWMVLYSQSVGRFGASQHITISGKKEATISFLVSSWQKDKIEKSFIDISLLNDTLIILYDDCVKIMDLNSAITKDQLLISTIEQKIENMSKLLKIYDEHCLLVSETKYELLRQKEKI